LSKLFCVNSKYLETTIKDHFEKKYKVIKMAFIKKPSTGDGFQA